MRLGLFAIFHEDPPDPLLATSSTKKMNWKKTTDNKYDLHHKMGHMKKKKIKDMIVKGIVTGRKEKLNV